MKLQLHGPSVAYVGLSLGNAMMHSVFGFYYVNVYLNKFHVSQSWFQVSQVVFMIWNAINDPLFGYCQDNYNFSWVKSRRHSILYGAPWFVMSFILIWFPWGDYSRETWLSGLQLMVVLCLYDTLFTFVLLAQCALFTEMSSKQEDRIRLVKYTQVANLIGSSTVFFTNLISNNLENYNLFCMSCVVIGGFAWLAISYTGRNSHTKYDLAHMEEKKLLGESVDTPMDRSSQYSVWQQTYQIATQRNFVSFVFMNFCQILLTTFYGNFTGIICDTLISREIMGSTFRSVFYGALYIIPQVLVLLGAPIVGSLGYYTIIKGSFVIQIGLGLFLFCLGPYPIVLVIFFLSSCSLSSATFSLFNLPLSDVIDADKIKYKRNHPLSSMVFGTNALITKPAQSFAPMLTVAILNLAGYEQFKAKQSLVSPPPPTVMLPNHYHYEDLHSAMFYLSCSLPIVISTTQLVLWSFFTIRKSHENIAKFTET